MSFWFISFAITWMILSIGVAANLGWFSFDFDGTLLTIMGGFGPFIAALIVNRTIAGKEGDNKIIRRMVNFQAKPKWWAVSVGIFAALFAISALIAGLLGFSRPDRTAGVYLSGGRTSLVLIILLLGSFGEETGWRGFALPRLQERFRPFQATLILTIVWWLWHLPTYWTLPLAMNAVQQFGFFAAFGTQFIVLFALGILCAWVYNGSRNNVFMPVLMHASWNFWVGAFGQQTSTFLVPLLLITAVFVMVFTKSKLGYKPAEKKFTNGIEI